MGAVTGPDHDREDCFVIDTGSLQGHWDDTSCGIEMNGFLCEFST